MTVKDLIAKLKEFPEDMKVYDYGSYEEEQPSDIFMEELEMSDNKVITVLYV